MTDIGIAALDARHRAKAKGKFEEGGAHAKEAYGSFKDGAQEVYAGSREHFEEGLQVVQDKVREKPTLAITAAVGVGILLGLLLRGPRTVYVRVPATTRS